MAETALPALLARKLSNDWELVKTGKKFYSAWIFQPLQKTKPGHDVSMIILMPYLTAGPSWPASSSPQVSTWYEGGSHMSRVSMLVGVTCLSWSELYWSQLRRRWLDKILILPVPHNLSLQVDSVLNQLSLSSPVMFSGLVTRLTSYPRILWENIRNTDPISLGKHIVSDDTPTPGTDLLSTVLLTSKVIFLRWPLW